MSLVPVIFHIGNYGNMIDGKNTTVQSRGDSSGEDEDEDTEEDKDKLLKGGSREPEWCSATDPIKPMTRDR